MMERTGLFLAIAATAVGAPYVLTQTDWFRSQPPAGAEWNVVAPLSPSGAPLPAAPNGLPQMAVKPRLEGPPAIRLEDAFRFDITPGWVTTYWSRVTTTVADLELEGFRVPLVTGTQQDDLAGSLTYYFDKQHRMQRIAFQGSTGDPRKLVAFVTHYYELRPEPTLGAGLYLAKWNGVPKSVLRVRHEPVVLANAPLRRFQVDLELNRPDPNYRLSPEMQQSLEWEQKAGRW